MDKLGWPLALCCARTGLMTLVTVQLQPARPRLLCYPSNHLPTFADLVTPLTHRSTFGLRAKCSVPLVGPLPPRRLTGLLFGESAQVSPCDSKRAQARRLEAAVTCRHQENTLPSILCCWPDLCPRLCHTSVGQAVKFAPQDTWTAWALGGCALWFAH